MEIEEKSLETLPFSEKTLESQNQHIKSLQEWEKKKKMDQINIPTDDKLVQMKLRELGEPIIFFGEEPLERRERLKSILTKKGVEETVTIIHSSTTVQKLPPVQNYPIIQDELFYTEGTLALKLARLSIAKFSLTRARERIQEAKRRRQEEEKNLIDTELEKKKLLDITENFNHFTITSSEVGDERPLSFCSFSPNSKVLATAGWSGSCKLWNVENSQLIHSLIGHSDRASCIVFHPQAYLTQSSNLINVATSSFDTTAMLWSLESQQPLQILKGHTHRIHKIAFHPSGRYIGTASFDMTWRLWDVETGKDLLEQEGHSRPLSTIGFQCDGSLVATAGADHIGRVWDLRSGKSIYVLRGHSKQIFGLDFSPNGYQLATCSEDNSIKIWDIRKKRNVYTIPAHSSSVTHVKFHSSGDLIISGSVDHTVKLWSGIDFSPLKIFLTEGKVMGCDLSNNLEMIATVSYDRTWRIFSKEEKHENHLMQE